MTLYQQIPSSVLALEYLADVEAFSSNPDAARTLHKTSSLYRDIAAAYGSPEAQKYALSLLRAYKARREVKPTAPKVEAPKRRGRRPGRQSADTLVSDRRLREAMLKAVNANGRVNRGVRRLAKDARISEASVRRALKAWEGSGQLTRYVYTRGKTQSIKPDLGHPAWSEYLPSHLRRS